MFNALIEALITARGGGVWKPYVVPSGLVAFDATTNNVPVTFKRLSGSDFIWTHGVYRTDNAAVEAGTDTFFGGIIIKFEDTAGLGQSGNSYYMVEDYFGHRGPSTEPYELVRPIVISGMDEITLQAQNLTGAILHARFEMIGLRKFPG